MKVSIHRGRRKIGWIASVFLAFCLSVAWASSARAERFGHVLVVEDDGRILDPANPLPLDHRRLEYRPRMAGGYTLSQGFARRRNRTLGDSLAFGTESQAATRIDLDRPIRFFGESYQSIWVHPHGAIAFGENWEGGVAAQATAPGRLLSGLLAGPPVVAALWNELLPARANASGVFVHQERGRVSITWLDVPSVRPARAPNSFFIEMHPDGRVLLEYSNLATEWGLVGLSPGSSRQETRVEDLRGVEVIGADQAVVGWYRDRPRLNPAALSRRVQAELPDRFEFLTVFTDQPVDAPHLVYAETVSNQISGLGQPIFDHGRVFGSDSLEHPVGMNDVGFWADDPTRPPRHPAYDYAPSTLSVLAHETGHRWLPRWMDAPFMEHSGAGHWSSGLSTAASLMGGAAFEDAGSGRYRVARSMQRFGYLDRYLMGLIEPEEVPPFFAIETAELPERPFPEGQIVTGSRRELVIEDLIEQLGERDPGVDRSPKKFGMAFVLVTGSGAAPEARDIYKIQRLRRAFVPYFRKASGGRARMATGLGPRQPIRPLVGDSELLAGRPVVLSADLFRGEDLEVTLDLEWADLEGNLSGLEILMDPALEQPPLRVDLSAGSYGRRRGAIQLSLAGLSPEASVLKVVILDSRGQTSSSVRLAIPL